MKTIGINTAINMMRTTSKAGYSFKLIHYTYNRTRGISSGLRKVEDAYIRAPLPKEVFQVSGDHYLTYKEDGENRMAWRILIRQVAFWPNWEWLSVDHIDKNKTL